MAVGLILIGAVVELAATNLQASAQNVAAVRLQQELRALTGVITRELRRARYHEGAVRVIGAGDTLAPGLRAWSDVVVSDRVSGTDDSDGIAATLDGDCIHYAYRSTGADDARTLSLARSGETGVVRIETGGDPTRPPSCESVGATRLSSSEVDVTRLSFNFDPARDTVLVTVEVALASDRTIRRRLVELVCLRSPRT